VAYDVLLKFEEALDFFLCALSLEKEHDYIIIKNLVKTLYKLINKVDSEDFNNEAELEGNF
jgi:hypothetical protein